jgi:hypothetical protein
MRQLEILGALQGIPHGGAFGLAGALDRIGDQ